jgi:hypothetical protein
VEQHGHEVRGTRANLLGEVGERCTTAHRDNGRAVTTRNADATKRWGFA